MNITVKGRLTTNIFKQKTDDFGNTNYFANLVFDPEILGQEVVDAQIAKINEIRGVELERVFEKKADAISGAKTFDDWCLREGEDEEYESSFGRTYVRLKSAKPFRTIKKVNGKVVEVDEDDDLLYPGCIAAVSLNAFAWKKDKQKGNGITLKPRGVVMFIEHGDRLSDATASDDDFDDFDSADTDGEYEEGSFE